MSMRLTTASMAAIIEAVKTLDEMEMDVQVEQIKVAGHTVFLGHEDGTHYVRGITDKTSSDGKVTR